METIHGEPWHALPTEELEAKLDTGALGLTRPTASARLTQYGPNQLEEAPPTPLLLVFLHQFQSPLIYILLAAGVVTLLLGELIDAGVIVAILVINALIGFTQERRAEVSVRALMRLVAPRARVVREGHEWEVESRELVPGDLVLQESGTRVPADLRLVSATALTVNESLLTGESVPTHHWRTHGAGAHRRQLSNPFLFWATAAALLVHVGALFFAPTRFVLRVVPLTEWSSWLRIIAVASSIIVAVELHKLLRGPPARRDPKAGECHSSSSGLDSRAAYPRP